ncbi:putative RNA polymerase II subunit B1 CTD phosphatase RPAP2 isoform X2 [Tachyglossus aculeatus]|uniref:putative RNA polymerase II subunit B1 CTD phosphatase RPAP2 isoform X2 n=1 Tax=Tachyglossus aculeatus TaxID=9261 RepID=UPI0018F5CD9E|nr:putative RNA polymerase II subunit B1 CTD phosphatase RPAP2 isoform X2 [Tachyglossus aculeatus]
MAERSGRGARRSAAGSKPKNALQTEDISKRKEELEATIRKKVEFERKALRIVEQLLEDNITEELLVESGRFISPSHYKDVVDERSIIKLCGYPLCQNKLGDVLKQKYRISTKTNKVYDITERKSFCSNFCYRASKYFETQIPKSPVWLREEESPPDFHLLKEGQSGHSGEEVKLHDEAIKASDVENAGLSGSRHEPGSLDTLHDSPSDTEQEFVSSILPGNRANATSFGEQLHKKSTPKKKPGQKPNPKGRDRVVAVAAEQLNKCRLDSEQKDLISVQKKSAVVASSDRFLEKRETSESCFTDCDRSQITLVGISKQGAERFRKKFAKPKPLISPAGQVGSLVGKESLLDVLKKTLMEWKTEETVRFLSRPKREAACSQSPPSATEDGQGRLGDRDLDSEPAGLRYSVAEKEGRDSSIRSLPFPGSDAAAKPVPSYESLKEETEAVNLRIREFYKGDSVLSRKPSKQQVREEVDPTFPLIDSRAQNQIRKHIVLEKLRKVLPGILGPLQITLGDVYTELKSLVRTFRLTNKNIIHKPAEWTLLAIVLMSSMPRITQSEEKNQENAVYTQFINTLLRELRLTNKDLESLTQIFKIVGQNVKPLQ